MLLVGAVLGRGSCGERLSVPLSDLGSWVVHCIPSLMWRCARCVEPLLSQLMVKASLLSLHCGLGFLLFSGKELFFSESF